MVEDIKEVRQLVTKKLPLRIRQFQPAFSKVESDVLPPHHKGVDHDIILKKESSTLTSSPLYSMLVEQLQLYKDYLKDYLRKGFIKPSNILYASPVLFAKKLRGG